jgi:hypothetical protein
MVITRVVFFRPQPDPGDWRPRPGYPLQVDARGVYNSWAIENLGDETVFEFEPGSRERARMTS